MAKEELLRVENLKKYFHTKSGTLHAVENVSFKLEEGKIVRFSTDDWYEMLRFYHFVLSDG